MTPQQLKAMKLALEVMRDQGDVSVDEWIATEKAIKEALAEHAMQEVQRLGQEIEQKPVAHCKVRPLRGDESFPKVEIDWVNQPVPGPLYTSPPQRKPLTDEAIAQIAAQGHQRWLEFARTIEAAHGIKGDT